MTHNPRRKADRDAIAALLVDLAEREGATATIEPSPLDGGLWVRIVAGPAHVTITVSPESATGYLTPWNSETQFAPAFGIAVGANVNPFHRCKCMGFARTLRDLVSELGDALRCITTGEAFL